MKEICLRLFKKKCNFITFFDDKQNKKDSFTFYEMTNKMHNFPKNHSTKKTNSFYCQIRFIRFD